MSPGCHGMDLTWFGDWIDAAANVGQLFRWAKVHRCDDSLPQAKKCKHSQDNNDQTDQIDHVVHRRTPWDASEGRPSGQMGARCSPISA